MTTGHIYNLAVETIPSLSFIDDLEGALEGDIAVFHVGFVVRGGEAGLGDELGKAPRIGISEGMLQFIFDR